MDLRVSNKFISKATQPTLNYGEEHKLRVHIISLLSLVNISKIELHTTTKLLAFKQSIPVSDFVFCLF